MRKALCVLVAAAAVGVHGTKAEPVRPSPYAGQETRAIRSLSAKDIDDLRNGRGWGLAKAAELNGMPGPVHLLELRKALRLTHLETHLQSPALLTSQQIAACNRFREYTAAGDHDPSRHDGHGRSGG